MKNISSAQYSNPGPHGSVNNAIVSSELLGRKYSSTVLLRVFGREVFTGPLPSNALGIHVTIHSALLSQHCVAVASMFTQRLYEGKWEEVEGWLHNTYLAENIICHKRISGF
jgi:hypothetical protein